MACDVRNKCENAQMKDVMGQKKSDSPQRLLILRLSKKLRSQSFELRKMNRFHVIGINVKPGCENGDQIVF